MQKLVLMLGASLLFVTPASAATFSGFFISGIVAENEQYDGSPEINLAGEAVTLTGEEPITYGYPSADFRLASVDLVILDSSNRPAPLGIAYENYHHDIVGFYEDFLFDGDERRATGSIDSPTSTQGWTITITTTGWSGVHAPNEPTSFLGDGESDFRPTDVFFDVTSFDDDRAPEIIFVGTPEPSEWTIIIAGFALLGCFTRQQKIASTS